MNYSLESPWTDLGGKISKKHTKVIWAKNKFGKRYTQILGARTTQPSTHELALRERFTAVRQMVLNRSRDLSKITQDQLAFIAQKDLASGKKTINAYLWYLCGVEYDQQHS